MENTRDLMDFTLKELRLVARLLSLLGTDKDQTFLLSGKITPEFNPDSGLVFLVDTSWNIAMISEDGYLEDWLRCPECQSEGFRSILGDPEASPCCKQFVKKDDL